MLTPTSMRSFSKSKLLAYRQCPKRLWLEIHKPELRDDSGAAMAFGIGNQVGDVARSLYDRDGTGVLIDIEMLGHEEALTRSAVLLEAGQAPVFEAGMKAGGALAYADVMLPDRRDGELTWKMIEVKSSASVKDYQRDDIAVQAHAAAAAGVRLSSVSLAHIDSSFVYLGDGDYRGLLKEVNLTDEAISRSGEVKEWIASARDIASLTDEPEVETGPQCGSPFACGFCNYCHRDKVPPEYPISSFPNLSGWRRTAVEAKESDDLREIPDDLLTAMQLRVKQCSVSGEAYFDAAGAAADLAPYGFPACFLDFETVMFAVPIWKGTRPYQQIPFQYSLHHLEEDGPLQHHGFLNLSGGDPSLACARSLIDHCGTQGPVFAYNAGFEKMVMRNLAARFPDLAPSLESIIARIVDLKPIARNRYYHPSQQGSWSLKAVLPAAVPELSYDQLEGVQNGGMAVEVYLEAINSNTTLERKQEIEKQLIEYCKLDTFAMVKLYQFFRPEPSGFLDKF